MSLPNLLKTTRQYFWSQKFTEVEVPYLNSSLPLEPNLYSFKTQWRHRRQNFYLPTSPEMALKKYLSQNPVNCFAISHCFRDLETEGPHHSKEFLMLEWYEIDQSLEGLMDSTKAYLSLFFKNLKYTTLRLPTDLPDNEADFNQFFLNKIEPSLPKNEAVFITGYPAFLSPLAESEATIFSERSEREDLSPKVASTAKNSLPNAISNRFELYINGIEIANGCTENRHPEQIKAAFEAEKKYRLSHHLPLHPYSQEFIDIISKIPPCAGIGLGLDRLAMITGNKSHI